MQRQNEDQHAHYTCENRRIMELFQDGGSRPVAIVRFNPDDYTSADNQRVRSCFAVDSKGFCRVKPSKQDEWQARLEVLFARIEDILSCSEMEKEVTIIHLFYN